MHMPTGYGRADGCVVSSWKGGSGQQAIVPKHILKESVSIMYGRYIFHCAAAAFNRNHYKCRKVILFDAEGNELTVIGQDEAKDLAISNDSTKKTQLPKPSQKIDSKQFHKLIYNSTGTLYTNTENVHPVLQSSHYCVNPILLEAFVQILQHYGTLPVYQDFGNKMTGLRPAPSGNWIITGGTSGIGFQMLKYLIQNYNVTYVVLIARNPLKNIYEEEVQKLRRFVKWIFTKPMSSSMIAKSVQLNQG
uniref:Fatty acid synthase n=1 Tax=Ditylenchus dipsaci TaxID=166011 RepID=A0A915DVI1_9BILA